jgi:LmbE family N-acetylglucosaminyl deacetylase
MRVLVLAPHADDETLGCGGTIARLTDEGHDVFVGLVTGHGSEPHPLYSREGFDTVRTELERAAGVLGVKGIVTEELPTVLVPDLPKYQVNAAVDRIIKHVAPDRLFVPFPFDLHRDHREIHHAASIAWRPYLESGRAIREVLCYEVPTETHLNIPYVEPAFVPNVWFDITGQIDRKIEAFECYESQVQPSPLPRSPTALRALAAWRGSQIGVAAAEAFVLVRAIH